MSKAISDVTVGKVTLVTNAHNPAVPKASNKFAIFKIFKREKVSKKAIESIEKIQMDMKINEIKV